MARETAPLNSYERRLVHMAVFVRCWCRDIQRGGGCRPPRDGSRLRSESWRSSPGRNTELTARREAKRKRSRLRMDRWEPRTRRSSRGSLGSGSFRCRGEASQGLARPSGAVEQTRQSHGSHSTDGATSSPRRPSSEAAGIARTRAISWISGPAMVPPVSIWAALRPDLQVTLLEPRLKRWAFSEGSRASHRPTRHP